MKDVVKHFRTYFAKKLSEELPSILFWKLEGLKRLLANNYQFTISERSRPAFAA